MSDLRTKRMLRVYEQIPNALMFLTGLFQSPQENFYEGESVEIDIIRSEEDVSIVVTDLTQGYRMNSTDLYTNKEFIPPIHKEAIALNSADLIKRMPGEHPFEDPGFRAALIEKFFKGMGKVERMIQRSIEWQASQILQTGTVDLKNEAGVVLYTIDFKPKAAHFVTVGTSWADPSSTKFDDIKSLSEVIRNNGQHNPDQLLFGCDAWELFIQDSAVLARFDNRRLDQGTVSPMQMRSDGGIFRGVVEIGNYRYDCWSYGGRYKDPETGTITQFITPDKVIVRASTGRLDATFGAIPHIGRALGAQSSMVIPELPGRLDLSDRVMDLHTNVWLSPSGEELFGGVGTRPLLIPTAIDTFGCLDVIP